MFRIYMCMIKPVISFCLIAAFLIPGIQLRAQSKVMIISRERNVVDGTVENIKEGDTLFLEAGQRKEILFKNLKGSAAKPIVIINRKGKVIINSEKDYGIYLVNSVHCKITGSGSSDRYGIEIASSKNHGLLVAEFSTDCEAERLDIHHVGFAGIVAKTDPNCTRKDLRFFIMKNLVFHDNYIHDTFAEGFYVGYSWYPARQFTCGNDSLLYPHEIHSVRIYNNILKNTGQEGIQVGCGTKDIKIFMNSVYNYGMSNELWQNHGVQIGQGTTGELFYNIINKGPGEGVSLFGGGNNFVHDNLIKNTGSSAIYQNDRGAVKNSVYKICNNRIINFTGKGLVLVSDYTTGNELRNNIFVTQYGDSAIADNGKNKWTISGNEIVYP